jgi:hypothetical protein
MRGLVLSILAIAMIAATTGCSGERDKGINKDKDRPKAEEKQT